MLEKAKKSWAELKKGKPGKRFQERYERKNREGRSGLRKPLMIGLGLVVFAAGIFFLPAPGPGIVIVALGAGMLAGESLLMARALDWAELKIRAVVDWLVRLWKNAPPLGKAGMILVVLIICAGVAYAGWKLTFGK